MTKQTTQKRPRLVVRKSIKNIQVQLVLPENKIVAGVSLPKKQAPQAGEKIAQLAKNHKIKQVSFDRGKHPYHGLVKQIAQAARKSGLEF